MKIIYIQCNMGVSGDMLIGALSELFDDRNEIENSLNSLGIPDVRISLEDDVKCGITGTKARVFVNSAEEDDESIVKHHHNSYIDVTKIIDSLNACDKVKEDAKTIYNSIAVAESKVHNTDVNNIHFHELGTMDAIADVVCCSYLFNRLNANKIIVSPINVGSGNVKCAHGILPVPAPATALLLEKIPFYMSDIEAELCTPTGASLIRHFATDFNSPTSLVAEKIGYGMASKSFDRANCLRAFLCEEEKKNSVIELSCNIDDMTAEEIAFACETFLSNGALDVYTTNIAMKKSRQGIKITVMCNEEDENKFLKLIFKHTTTTGIRKQCFERFTLERKIKTVNTPIGKVRVKLASGYCVRKEKAEFEDLKKIAVDNSLSLKEVKKIVESNF